LSVDHVAGNVQIEIELKALKDELKADLDYQKSRKDEFTEKLQTAADVRAAAALAD
jgi:hypothetical protein